MKITPLYPMILIKPDGVEDKTESGILLPGDMKKEPNTGVVMQSTCEEVKDGQRVMWKPLTGTYADDLLLVDISNILVVFEDGDKS